MCGGRQCDEGCCPYSGWVCCEDGLHCADTEAECRPDKLRMEVVKTIPGVAKQLANFGSI